MQGQDQQSRQRFIERLQEATEKLRSADNPEEQTVWAQQVAAYADQISGRQQGRTGITVEAQAPSTEVLQRLAQEVEKGQLRGVREISYRRDSDGTGRIRVTTTEEALPQASSMLQTVGEHVQQPFASSSQQQ